MIIVYRENSRSHRVQGIGSSRTSNECIMDFIFDHYVSTSASPTAVPSRFALRVPPSCSVFVSAFVFRPSHAVLCYGHSCMTR